MKKNKQQKIKEKLTTPKNKKWGVKKHQKITEKQPTLQKNEKKNNNNKKKNSKPNKRKQK